MPNFPENMLLFFRPLTHRNKSAISSALALKELLSPIRLEPVSSKDADFYQLFAEHEKDFKPYYVAHTKIETLALLDEKHKGSNWLQWRCLLVKIRTFFDENPDCEL